MDETSTLISTATSESSLQIPSATKPTSKATDDIWVYDTIHYLSPATTAKTALEGDFDYVQFGYPPFGTVSLPPFSTATSLSCEEAKLQRTIAIIKPEAMVYKDVVLKTVVDNGFSIVAQRTIHLTPEQATEIYTKHYGCPYFPNMVVSLSMGPCLVLSMARLDAVEKWKSMVGPYNALPAEWFLPLSVRTRFGLRMEIEDALHASEGVKDAARENRYFYPENILEPIISDQYKVEDYINLHVRPTLLAGLTELVRKKPVEPIIFLAEWLLQHNPFQQQSPYKYALAPT